ncbi:MAG: hypothetical protein WCO84_04555 [bacterium]
MEKTPKNGLNNKVSEKTTNENQKISKVEDLSEKEIVDTPSRLRTLALARECGVKAFPTIHPYSRGFPTSRFFVNFAPLGTNS